MLHKTMGHYTRWIQTRIRPGFLSGDDLTKTGVQHCKKAVC